MCCLVSELSGLVNHYHSSFEAGHVCTDQFFHTKKSFPVTGNDRENIRSEVKCGPVFERRFHKFGHLGANECCERIRDFPVIMPSQQTTCCDSDPIVGINATMKFEITLLDQFRMGVKHDVIVHLGPPRGACFRKCKFIVRAIFRPLIRVLFSENTAPEDKWLVACLNWFCRIKYDDDCGDTARN